MKLRALIAMICACFMLGSTVAFAQLSTGASGQSSAPREASEKEYWYLIRSMGDCLASSKNDKAVAFLNAEIGSEAEEDAFEGLFTRRRNICMRNFVRASFRRAHVRGAIAEALYRDNLATWPAGTSPAAKAPDTIGSIHDFANCYVAGHFVETQRFLAETKLSTNDEMDYLRKMAPDFSPCLPKTEVTLKPINLRMALAEAMYHATRVNSRVSDGESGPDA